MFEESVQRAMRYTMPVVGLRRKYDGAILSTLAAFTVVNDEGWVLTAAHVVREGEQAVASISNGRGLHESIAKLHHDHAMPAEKKREELARREAELRGFLTHSVELWAVPGIDRMRPSAVEAFVDEPSDLALVRIEPFDHKAFSEFPRFRPQSRPLVVGTGICRIGFPFHNVDASFAEDRSSFDINAGFPVPAFALEGMISRFEDRIVGERHVLSLQTSTPGLRGQSGGPVIDADGYVVGIQSRTVHLDLGFDAQYDRAGERVTERQFINVGVASHVDEVCRFMDEHEVAYTRG